MLDFTTGGADRAGEATTFEFEMFAGGFVAPDRQAVLPKTESTINDKVIRI